MTLHVNTSESVSQKILAFLESLSKQGESIEIIDDAIYQYEKKGILKGLKQIENKEYTSSDELINELMNHEG